MKIIEKTYAFNSNLHSRTATKYIIIHHSAGTGSADAVHSAHLSKGWAGIGYHFYVRLGGEVYRGRPQNTIGAHCIGYNEWSIGVCFEGNYQTDREMPAAQLKAGKELITYLKGVYPNAKVKMHKNFVSTACPGQYFPFEEISKGVKYVKKELTTANDITWELSQMIEIKDVDGFREALEKARKENSPLYWGLRKIVNGRDEK